MAPASGIVSHRDGIITGVEAIADKHVVVSPHRGGEVLPEELVHSTTLSQRPRMRTGPALERLSAQHVEVDWRLTVQTNHFLLCLCVIFRNFHFNRMKTLIILTVRFNLFLHIEFYT